MPRPTIPLDELTAYLFGPGASALSAEVGAWLAASPRLRLFAERYRDKIRKRVRGLADDEGRRDLGFELATARRLLDERRFAVEYEPYGAAERAPDFRVAFRDRLLLNVEVRRLRPAGQAGAAVERARVVRAVCDKLGQLRPSMINVLVVGADVPSSLDGTLVPAMRWLDERAVRKDDDAFRERGFTGTREFARRFQRLSAVLWVAGGPEAGLWRNPRARHPLPADLASALRSASAVT